MQIGREDIQLSWCTGDRIIYVENPKGLTKTLDAAPGTPWQE